MAKVKHRERLYKQMALETGTRNPERFYGILKVFSKFEGFLLDDSNILSIYAQLFIDGAVDSGDIDASTMSESKIKKIIKETKSHNNEWGFPTGYQAAFTRYLKTLSEFGFIYAQYNEKLKLSEVAKAVVKDKITLSEAFAVQSMRFFRASPYRRVLNDFNYFSFILKVIRALDSKGKKLSYPQLMLSLFSQTGNVRGFLKILEENKIGNDLKKAYNVAKRIYYKKDGPFGPICSIQTAFRDYGDAVFRTLQLTGFITVEKQGCLMISFNSNRLELYNFLSKIDFSLNNEEKESEKKYFNKLGTLPQFILNEIYQTRDIQQKSVEGYNERLQRIIQDYDLNKKRIADMLINVSNGKKDKSDFNFIQAPLKFEFLLSLYLYACLGDEYDYKPNYKCDTAGIPYSHAPGNIGDIEVFNENRFWLIEATLIRGKTQQVNSETVNLFRHIDDNHPGTKYMSLVAPYIHDDTELLLKVATVVTMEEKKSLVFSKPYSTQDFIVTMHTGDCIKDMQDTTRRFVSRLRKFLNKVYLPNS